MCWLKIFIVKSHINHNKQKDFQKTKNNVNVKNEEKEKYPNDF